MSITLQPSTDEHVVVGGTCAPEFEPVAAIFARVVAETPGGAAVCVYREGVPVVDLHGGTTYGPDSRQLVFSVAKAVSAIAAHVAAERGELDLDQPVATFWPEFRRTGTQDITTRTALAQRAGLPTVDRPSRCPRSSAAVSNPLWSSRSRTGNRAPITATTRSPSAPCSTASSSGYSA